MKNVKTVAKAYTSEKGHKEFFDAVYHGFCEDKTLQTQFFRSIEACRSYFQYHTSKDLNILDSAIESLAFAICKKWFYQVIYNNNYYYTHCQK